MDGEGRIKLAMVPATKILGKGLIYIEKEHVLSALLMMHTNENYVPFFRLTQQPIWRAMPLYPMHSRGNMIISKLPLSTKNERHNKPYVDETPIMAIPIFWISPEGFVPNFFDNNERQTVTSQGERGSGITGSPGFSYSERKENWYIRRLARSKGNRSDPYYVHVQTNKQFRSLVDVHKYIVHGHLPHHSKRKAGEIYNPSLASPPNKLRGDKLLNRIPVGHYNLSTNQVFRDDQGRHKRKREPETLGQEGEEVSNVDFQTPRHIYTLYDFELKLG